MITREDFDKLHFKGNWENCYDLAVELLKERDAYRKVAILEHSAECFKVLCVDIEAERIMEEGSV